MNKPQYVKELNAIGTPFEDLRSNGGRIPDGAKYGVWLRRNDPIAFNVGFNEARQREERYQPKTGARCSCRPGIARDNCPACEGTGWRIDFAAIRSTL